MKNKSTQRNQKRLILTSAILFVTMLIAFSQRTNHVSATIQPPSNYVLPLEIFPVPENQILIENGNPHQYEAIAPRVTPPPDLSFLSGQAAITPLSSQPATEYSSDYLQEEFIENTPYPEPVYIEQNVFESYFISETQFRYAPLIDNFDTEAWFEANAPGMLLTCFLEQNGAETNISAEIDNIAQDTGIDPRILISLVQLTFDFQNYVFDDCSTLDIFLDDLLQKASNMMQATLAFRFGGEALEIVHPIIQVHQEEFINDASFAVADAVLKTALDNALPFDQQLELYYTFYNSHFAPDASAIESMNALQNIVNTVVYRMPFIVSRRYSGGPHGGANVNSCAAIPLSDASGIDLSGDGDPNHALDDAVLSIAPGVVEGIKTTTDAPGRWVAIKHDNGIVSMYWHLSSINSSLSKGQRVESGAYLGELGASGCTGCSAHIHVELRRGGTNYDVYGGIGDPVPWSGVILDGWGIYAEIYPSGKAVNYYGSAVRMDAVNYIQSKTISIGCGGGTSVTAAVEPGFPNTTEKNTTNTYFAFSNGNQSIFESTNFAHCPATQTLEFVQPSAYSLTGMCGSIAPSDTIPPSASGFSASVAEGRIANISTSGVQDNSGGSGIREVRFSAKWSGTWHGIGTDSSYPYSLSWDMCSSNVPNGDVELGMEVWDNVGNKWVWSSHYGNPHINKSSACGGNGTTPTGAVWNMHGWMNKYLAGYTNWEGTVTWDNGNWPYIYFDWSTGSPFGWSGDEFSLRLWRNVYFPGGFYDFRTDADDGVKVYVDGNLVVNRWWDGSGAGGSGRDISAGWHEVKVEYYENKGDAKLSVVWYGPGFPEPDSQAPNGNITSPSHLSATNNSPLTISAEAWDDVSGVNYVRFMAWYCQNGDCNWHQLSTDYSAPYSYSWYWTSIPEQHVWLAIHVADKSGKITYDPGGWTEIDLDKTNPSAQITSPGDSWYLTENSVMISATASDNGSGISSVQFFAGYTRGAEDYWHNLGFDTDGSNGWQKSWNATAVNDQQDISFFIYAYDKAGNYVGNGRWNNTLDRTPPSSFVRTLPPNSSSSFTVRWIGTDATSGISSYDVQYQQDAGDWTYWKYDTTATVTTFTGQPGHSYAFRSRARDRAGFVEAWPVTADTITEVIQEHFLYLPFVRK